MKVIKPMQKRNLTILMLTEYYFPFDRGGTERSVHCLARALVEKGYSAQVLTPNFGASNKQTIDRVQVHRFAFYLKLNPPHNTVSPWHFANPVWWILCAVAVVKFIRKERPSVIHAQGKYYLPVAVLVGKIFRIPVVVTLRDYIPLCPYALCIAQERGYHACSLVNLITRDMPRYLDQYAPNSGLVVKLFIIVSGIYGWLTSHVLKFFIKQCDWRVAISKSLKRIYETNGVNINAVIYNSTQFPPVRPEYKRKEGIVYVGRLTPGKGVGLLVQAYRSLKKYKLPLLTLVGDGILRKKIRELQDGDIRLVGQLPYKKTLELMSHARIIVIPSIWEEPFGRVALEALGLGVPVVATDKGALTEIIENGKTGIVVEATTVALAKGIEIALSQEKELRQEIIHARPRLIQKFGDRPLRQYLAIYQ